MCGKSFIFGCIAASAYFHCRYSASSISAPSFCFFGCSFIVLYAYFDFCFWLFLFWSFVIHLLSFLKCLPLSSLSNNNYKPWGFTCTLVSPLCVYKITQIFPVCKMAGFLKLKGQIRANRRKSIRPIDKNIIAVLCWLCCGADLGPIFLCKNGPNLAFSLFVKLLFL